MEFVEDDECKSCNDGTICPEASDGRFFDHPKLTGVMINIPSDYIIPRCDNPECRQMFFTETEMPGFWDMLDEELEKHRSLIAKAVHDFREKQK